MKLKAAMRPVFASLALVLALAWGALALTFPPLSGRLVDEAGIVPQAARASILTKLSALEEKSGIQFVVATVKSLEGDSVENYANLLFRFWKLGETQKNNGVLLLIAPNERKLRIEVGYGLEGTLTDALSKVVIANAIAPRFKSGDFAGGIERGVDDVIAILTTDASEWQARPKIRDDAELIDYWIPLIIGGLVLSHILIGFIWPRWGRRRRNGVWGSTTGGSSWSSGGSGSSWSSSSSSSSSGSSYSGGGGSSGGGGASGEW